MIPPTSEGPERPTYRARRFQEDERRVGERTRRIEFKPTNHDERRAPRTDRRRDTREGASK